jgi:hypothetical protein
LFIFKVCTGDHRQTALWGTGDQVKGNSNLEKGTTIDLFGPDGKYARGHAAIYVGQDQNGIQVLDQWAERPSRPAHPVAPRTIRWDGKTRPTMERFSTSSSELIDAIHQEPRLLI